MSLLARSTLASSALCLVCLMGCGSNKPSAPAKPGQVMHVTTDSFESLISQEKPVLVDFWAPWCGPCRTQGPILDQAATMIGDRALVGKVNVDEEKALARRFQIRSIPTLILFKDGKELQRFSGVQQAGTLVSAIKD